MAVPKIKLYRLDQSYDPSNDTDIQSVNNDEIYPFVEKQLDLTKYEQLVGVTYKDLMVGKSAEGYSVEILMLNNGTEEAPSYDRFKSAFQNCDCWRLDNIKVYLSTDGGSNYSSVVPEKYYRLNFKTLPIFDDDENPTSKRQTRYVQVEFGKWIYSGVGDEAINFLPSPTNSPVNKVKLEYSLFTDDIVSGISSGEILSLQNGHIYDGTHYGRRQIVSNGVPTPISDENGVPFKVEGNIGYKIRTYPCRQLVAYSGDDAIGSSPSGRSFVKDLQISSDGKIIVTDCQNWILAQTDDRRPRLFERIEVTGLGNVKYTSYLELEQGVQYSSSLTTDPSGNFNLVFQLSSEYYNVSYGVYVYPKELFIRYNEEDDLLEDVFQPNYLDLSLDGDLVSGTWSKTNGTDTADLTTNLSSFSSIGKREFKMALTSEAGYEHDSNDLELTWSGDSFSIAIPNDAYENRDTIKVWENGVLIYDRGAVVEDQKYASVSVSQSSFSMTLSNDAVEASAVKPESILISYVKTYSLSNQMILSSSEYVLTSDQTFQSGKQYFIQSGSLFNEAEVTVGASVTSGVYYELRSGYKNPWAFGWRICAYEKTKSAKIFVSSFRNWVSDHLNNSPDVFKGFTEYDGSSTNQTGINYITGDFSILHRNGAVLFSNPVTQIDFTDVKNNYSSSASINYQNISYETLKMYTNLVYAKFAYYDGLQDVNNGLLRKISSGSNFFTYKMINDPTYITDENPRYDSNYGTGNAENYDSETIDHTSIQNKRWIIRNDSKMPTIFYKDNDYLPSPVYSNEVAANKWEPDQLIDGKFLQMNLSSYRSLFIKNEISAPAITGMEANGQTKTKYANLSWSPSYSGATELKDTPEPNSVIFPVKCEFIFDSRSGKWKINSVKLQAFEFSSDTVVDAEKQYFIYSPLSYSYTLVTASSSPSGNGYYEKNEIDFSSRDLTEEMSAASILQVMKGREKIIYNTSNMCPYYLVFLCGENGLIVSARQK